MDIVTMEPLHPKLVHVPIALAAIMPMLASGLLLAWQQGWLPRRAWTVALLVGGVLAALNTGEVDAEEVERGGLREVQ